MSDSEGLGEKLIPTNIKGYSNRKLALSRDISTVKNRHAHSPGEAMRGGRDSMKPRTHGMARMAELVMLGSGEEQSSEAPSEAV